MSRTPARRAHGTVQKRQATLTCTEARERIQKSAYAFVTARYACDYQIIHNQRSTCRSVVLSVVGNLQRPREVVLLAGAKQ